VTRSEASRPPSALIIINGDDVYEDLFTAGLKLADILVAAGLATRTAMGTACLDQYRLDPQGVPDLVVLYTALGCFPPSRQAALASAVRSGAGLLAVHAANVFPGSGAAPGPDDQTAYQLIGSRYASHGPAPHESRFLVETDLEHPVTRRLAPFEITHEHYRVETADDVRVVAWRHTPARREPIAYVRRDGRGRVCYLQLGHDMRAWDDPPVREFVTRAARWARREVAA
jgi:type 1 glutamine amidotransferase